MTDQEDVCCHRCNFRSKYQHRLQTHLKVHELSNTVTCTPCGIIFQNLKSMAVWHTKNNLKEHLVSRGIFNGSLTSNGIFKKRLKKSFGGKGLKEKVRDKLNTVLFRKDRTSEPLDQQNRAGKLPENKIIGEKTTFCRNDEKAGVSCFSKSMKLIKLSDIKCANTESPLDSIMSFTTGENITFLASDEKQGGHISKEPVNLLNDRLELELQRCASHKTDCAKFVEANHGQVPLNNDIVPVNTDKKSPSTDAEIKKAKEKFQCKFCCFKTKYKHLFNFHRYVHVSSDSVSCTACNIVFSSKKSLAVWHSKNNLKEHVSSVMKSKKKVRVGPVMTQTLSDKKDKITENKFSKLNFRRAAADKLHNVKETPVKLTTDSSSTETPSNSECTDNTARTCMDKKMKVCEELDFDTSNLTSESCYCDDFSTHTLESRSIENNSSSLAESGHCDKVNMDTSEVPTDEVTNGNTNDGMSSSDNKDLNNNELGDQHDESKEYERTESRDENNNLNKDSGDGSDGNEDSFNDRADSPKSVELLTCLVCQASFSVRDLLMKHLLKVHNLTNLCKICYFRDSQIMKFANPVSLRNHRLRYHQKEMKRCVCEALFIDDKTLQSHQRKFRCTEMDHPKLHRCICGKRFATEKGLNFHMSKKCRKRKLTDSGNRHVLKLDRNSRVSANLSHLKTDSSSYEKQQPGELNKTASVNKIQKTVKNGKTITPIRTSKNVPQAKQLSNKCTSKDGLSMKIEEKRVSIQNVVTDKQTCMPALRKKITANKGNGCKICNAKVKQCDIFSHQKISHQRRTGFDSVRTHNLRSGSLKKFRCGWCRFVAVHWKTILYHHYSNHQQWELDVIVLRMKTDQCRIKPCSVVLHRI